MQGLWLGTELSRAVGQLRPQPEKPVHHSRDPAQPEKSRVVVLNAVPTGPFHHHHHHHLLNTRLRHRFKALGTGDKMPSLTTKG